MAETTEAAPSSGKVAAYDTRLARYVGGVRDTKTAAKAAAKDRGVAARDVEVREV